MCTGERRAELDGVRGLAILLVLVGHSGHWAPFGPAGVTLFFALSGYLIASALLKEQARAGRIDLPRFYWRRFTRLAPPLFTMLIGTGILLAPDWRPSLAAATWTSNYVRLSGVDLGPYQHTWSLGVEEQFYLLFPLALGALLSRRSPARALGLVVAALMAWRLGVLSTGDVALYAYTYEALEMAGSAILVGCLVALARWQLRGEWATVGIVALVGIGVAATALGGVAYSFVQLAATPIAATIVAAAPSCRWLAWRPLAFCGVVSYSVYLWHYPIAHALGASVATVTLGALVGLGAYVAVEAPLMRWRARSVRQVTDPIGRPLVGEVHAVR